MAVIVAKKTRKPARWIDPDAWQAGRIPTEDDEVVIPQGCHVPACKPLVARCKALTVVHAPSPEGRFPWRG